MKLHTVRFNSVRNEVLFLSLVATIRRIFQDVYGNLSAFKYGQDKVDGMENVLRITVKVNHSFVFFSAFLTWHFDVGDLFSILDRKIMYLI